MYTQIHTLNTKSLTTHTIYPIITPRLSFPHTFTPHLQIHTNLHTIATNTHTQHTNTHTPHIKSLHLHTLYTTLTHTSPLAFNITLYIHYIYTIHTLYIHYKYTIYTLYIHYTYTIHTLYIHFVYTLNSIFYTIWVNS